MEKEGKGHSAPAVLPRPSCYNREHLERTALSLSSPSTHTAPQGPADSYLTSYARSEAM